MGREDPAPLRNAAGLLQKKETPLVSLTPFAKSFPIHLSRAGLLQKCQSCYYSLTVRISLQKCFILVQNETSYKRALCNETML